MKEPNLTDIDNPLTSASTHNANNAEIRTAFNNTLSRDGSTPNQMEADLDMNSNDILNVRNILVSGNLLVQGSVTPVDSRYVYPERSSANAAALAAELSDGEVGILAGLTYEKDSTSTGTASATNDLSVDGLIPFGVTYVGHFGGGEQGADRALNHPATYILDFENEEITLSDTLIVERGNIRVRNMNFTGDISASTESRRPSVKFQGTVDTAVNFTANSAAGSATITVGGTPQPVVVDQWVWVKDDRSIWSGGTAGETAQVREVSGSAGAWAISFYEPLELPYTTADTARIEPMNMLSNIVIEGGLVSGDVNTDDQTALWFFACDNVLVEGHEATDTDYAHMAFETCGRTFVRRGRGRRTGTLEGLDYGVAAFNSTYLIDVDSYHGSSQRHATTTGGSLGMVKHYRVRNSRADDHFEAGFDAHPGTVNTTIENCEVYIRDGLATSADGVICQGLRFTARNNRIWGMTRHGVFFQPTPDMGTGGDKAQCTIEGNWAKTDQQAFSGVGHILSLESGGPDTGEVVISDNFAEGVIQVAQCFLKDATTDYCDISRNRGIATSRAAQIRANSGATLSRWKMSENRIEVDSGGSEGLYVLEISGGSIGSGILASNHIIGGTSAFRITGAGDVVSDGANIADGSTSFWSLSGNNSVRINEVLEGSTTFDPASLAAGASLSTTVTVDEAQPGDAVVGVSHSTSLLGDVVLDVEGVIGTDTVRVRYTNLGAVTRDVTSGTLRVFVRKATN